MPMRTEITLTILLTCLTQAACAADPGRMTYRGELSGKVNKSIGTGMSALLSFYEDLHTHPELSLQEHRSAGKIAQRLRDFGYQVTTGVGGTGVVGILENGSGPTVLIRGDMDALPIIEDTGVPYASRVRVERPDGQSVGVMHACGHDIHQTCLVGTAGALSEMRDKWHGRVMIVGQPAEEIGAGARMMIEDGLFERFAKPNYCIALHVSGEHPAGTVAYCPGWALANVDSVDIAIFGRGGHGSRPHQTIDPVVIASQVVIALQTIVSRRLDPQEPGVITVGSIHAGSKHNIISDEAKLQITVRSYGEQTRRLLLDGIREVTINTCRALGCARDPEVAVREHEFTPSTFNDPTLTNLGANVFRSVLGAENVIRTKPVMGGEDFGRFSEHLGVPGFIFWLGSVHQERFENSLKPGADPLPSLHSSKYYPDPVPTIETGVKCMTSLAMSLLQAKE
jgi:hippurate hydrolase